MSCNSDEPEVEPETPDPKDSVNTLFINADSISNHLQFYEATKIQGTIPNGPAGSSLKISFEDTLYLTNELKVPIKFLHERYSENVAGMYVQVHGAAGGFLMRLIIMTYLNCRKKQIAIRYLLL